MRSVKNRIEKLEEEIVPREFDEIKIVNPNCRMPGLPELLVIRSPKKKRRKR